MTLKDAVKYENIIIYGAGPYSYYITSYLKTINSNNIKCIAVTSKSNNPASFVGYDVKEISEIPQDDCILIIPAVSKKHYTAIEKILSENGWSNIFWLSDDDLNEIAFETLRRSPLLKEAFTNTESDYVVIDGVKMANPSKCNTTPWLFLSISSDIFGDYICRDEKLDFNLITEGQYEYNKVMINKNDVVLDLGANIGIFSCLAAAKGAKVYSFEPDSELINDLEKQSSLHNGAIIPVRYACSDFIGKSNFGGDIQDDNTSYKIQADNTAKVFSETVDVTTIDSFVKKNNIEKIDFIKADIEGAERYMLMGARETIKEFAPKLAICTYHLPDDKEVLEKIVREINSDYNIIHKWKKMFCWVD